MIKRKKTSNVIPYVRESLTSECPITIVSECTRWRQQEQTTLKLHKYISYWERLH